MSDQRELFTFILILIVITVVLWIVYNRSFMVTQKDMMKSLIEAESLSKRATDRMIKKYDENHYLHDQLYDMFCQHRNDKKRHIEEIKNCIK